ncbi:hypothetical protein E2C06_27980 [Dankookia rubra]|uniref:histidine kinase n=1 Tax=Dankookia rubra TaxID=1442381 RepID=A0A4V3A9H9_9PROT|nr:hypothetical protein E2C06_27980 [Dankookia rubra]
MARAHTLPTQRRWAGADLHDLVRGDLRPVLPPGEAYRLRVEGPAVLLSAQAAQPLATALRELATNAARHGALFGPAGQVAVTWSGGREHVALHLTWCASGGSPARRRASASAGGSCAPPSRCSRAAGWHAIGPRPAWSARRRCRQRGCWRIRHGRPPAIRSRASPDQAGSPDRVTMLLTQ